MKRNRKEEKREPEKWLRDVDGLAEDQCLIPNTLSITQQPVTLVQGIRICASACLLALFLKFEVRSHTGWLVAYCVEHGLHSEWSILTKICLILLPECWD